MKASSPLDCPEGLHCQDYECEWRHLDEQEQAIPRTLSGKPQPPKKVIITASPDMGRTASTWVFNAVRLLLRQAQQPCDSYWMRTITADKLQARVHHPNAASTILIKTHEVASPRDIAMLETDVLPHLSHIIVSQRDDMPSHSDFWKDHATHVTQFEEIVNQPLRVLQQLAGHTNLAAHLTDQDYAWVDYHLMTLPIPGNQASKFWSFHARRGGRPVPPRPTNEKHT